MKRSLTAILLLLFITLSSVVAQDNTTRRRQWMNEMQKTKLEFMAKELGLSAEQKEQFGNVFNAMNEELDKLRRETRDMEKEIEKKKNATDLEYEKVAEAMFELKTKEGNIENRYFDQLRKVLTPRQLYLFKKAEHKWMKELMKHRKKQ